MADVDWAPVIDWTGEALGGVDLLEEVDSTNAEFLRRPPAGPGARPQVLVARHQTRGRGRRGRPWHAQPDQSVLCTVGLEKRPAGLTSPCLPLLGAVAVCDLVQVLGLGATRCKWPNDVLLAGRKLAGVLVEMQSVGAQERIALGIGLNVGAATPGLGNAFDTPPTSLAAAGYTGSPGEAGAALLTALDQRLTQARDHGPEPLIAAWLALLLGPSGQVQVELPSRTLEARLVGFTPDGSILIESAPGAPPERLPGGRVLSLRAREDLPPR